MTTAHHHTLAGHHTGPRPGECGTSGGYTAHYRNGTPPCPACRKARARYTTERRVIQTRTARIPVDLLARLYLDAHPALQAEMEDQYGESLMTRVLAHHHRQEAPR